MRFIFFLVLLAGIGMAGFGVYMVNERYNVTQQELAHLRTLVGSRCTVH